MPSPVLDWGDKAVESPESWGDKPAESPSSWGDKPVEQPASNQFAPIEQDLSQPPKTGEERAARDFTATTKLGLTTGNEPLSSNSKGVFEPFFTFRHLSDEEKYNAAADFLSMPGLSPQRVKEVFPKQPGDELSKAGKFASGAIDATQDLENSFLSPIGLATLGIGALPQAMQRIVAGAFAVQMATQTPEAIANVKKAFDSGDPKQIGEALTGAAGNVAMVGLSAKHALTPSPKPTATPLEAKADEIAPVAPLTAEALKETAKVETPIAAEVDTPKEEVATQPLAGASKEVTAPVEELSVGTKETPPTESNPTPKPAELMTPEEFRDDLKWVRQKGKRILMLQTKDGTVLWTPADQKGGKLLVPHEQAIANLHKKIINAYLSTTSIEGGKAVRKPVSAKSMEAYGLEPSYGYVKEGDNYVFNPKAYQESRTPISEGPGAASPGDVPGGSELKQLTESISKSVPKDSSLPEQISAIDRVKTTATDVKESAIGSLAKAKAIGDAIWQKYTGLPEFRDEQRAVGEWTYANQKADFEARKFQKSIEKAVPDKLRREAMTNWIQADGDAAILRARADASKGSIKRGYEAALKLTDYEQTIAKNIRSYLESQLQKGIEGDILKSGVENYINQVWKRENPVTRKLMSDFSAGKLQPDFKFAKKRIFDSYFEGEQIGRKPANKDVGALIAFYDQAFNKSLSARGFLKDLHEGNASDGRPLVEVSGSGKIIEGDKDSRIIIKPRTQGEQTWDYRKVDHPAMRGWKWVANDAQGNPVLLQGDLLVHPEAYTKLRNRLQSSAWRTFEIGGFRPGVALLNAQSTIKQTMLSVSGFHQAQETIHAFGHRFGLDAVKQSAHDFIQTVTGKDVPWLDKLEKLDFDNPLKKDLISHGLQVADYHAMSEFGEGLASGPLTNKIPWVGNRILKPYTEWLFQDYIPRLKMTLAVHAFERNMQRFESQIKGGKITRDQVLELSARQADAAFGELNYKYMGRNPTLQDTFRAFLLAPDFLEARTRFVAQGLKPEGRGVKGVFTNEQIIALGLLAASQYVTARIFNKMLDDDYHWDKPFGYVYKGREYGIRTVPGDVAHLIDDTRKFSYNRLSPLLGRGGIELIFGRDDRGVKRDLLEQLKDTATTAIPISMRKRDDIKIWESFLNSFGMHERNFSSTKEVAELARTWVKENKPKSAFDSIYDAEKDVYRPLRIALLNKDVEAAQKAYDELKKSTTPAKIISNVKGYYTKPFTGSHADEIKFLKTLDAHGKERYDEARKERQGSLQLFYKLKK